MMERYLSANEYFKKIFGEKVQRISIDAGFSCPNRDGTKGIGGCIYCSSTGSKASYTNSTLSVKEQIEDGLKLFKNKARKFIAYFQAFSNTYAHLTKLKEIYKPAIEHPDVVGISIGTRPDCIDDEKLDYFEEIAKEKFLIIEYGVQTLNDSSLLFINRGHNSAQSIEAIRKTKKRKNINIVAHLIFLLPEDNLENMIYTIKTLVDEGVNGFKFHHLYVERNTTIEKLYTEGKINLLELEEYIEILGKVISILPQDIVLHRLFGDCSKDNLIAPLWTLNKTANINLLRKYLTEKDIYQGKFAI
ncbi:MAG: TIGR01212 family radical SAM protein [Brevinematales bacterium]